MSQETNPEIRRKRSKNLEKWSRNIGKKARNKVQLVQIIIELAKEVLIFEYQLKNIISIFINRLLIFHFHEHFGYLSYKTY